VLPEIDESLLPLPELFHYRMLQIYVTIRDELDYCPRRLLQSGERHVGLEHAKRSLRRQASMQQVLKKLKDEGRKWQTMEAHIIDPQFAPLFAAWEIAEAKRRLG